MKKKIAKPMVEVAKSVMKPALLREPHAKLQLLFRESDKVSAKKMGTKTNQALHSLCMWSR